MDTELEKIKLLDQEELAAKAAAPDSRIEEYLENNRKWLEKR